MEFLYRDEPQENGSSRRILYPNKSNMPKGEGAVRTVEIPTDKPNLMVALQELFDMIDWTGTASGTKKEDSPAAPAPIIQEGMVQIPSSGELTIKDQLALRMLLSVHWTELPLTFKADVATLALEDIRPHLDELKAKAIGL